MSSSNTTTPARTTATTTPARTTATTTPARTTSTTTPARTTSTTTPARTTATTTPARTTATTTPARTTATTKPVSTTPSAALNKVQDEINKHFDKDDISETNQKINSALMNQNLETFSNILYDNELTTSDIYQRDLNTALDQQNALYIVGTITCATLLITAILIAR